MLSRVIERGASQQKPLYQHDCDACVFQGILYFSLPGVTTQYDIYTCRDSILARYGNEGHQYVSLMDNGRYCAEDSNGDKFLMGNALLAHAITSLSME